MVASYVPSAADVVGDVVDDVAAAVVELTGADDEEILPFLLDVDGRFIWHVYCRAVPNDTIPNRHEITRFSIYFVNDLIARSKLCVCLRFGR